MVLTRMKLCRMADLINILEGRGCSFVTGEDKQELAAWAAPRLYATRHHLNVTHDFWWGSPCTFSADRYYPLLQLQDELSRVVHLLSFGNSGESNEPLPNCVNYRPSLRISASHESDLNFQVARGAGERGDV
jgi:hypothetical protein